jgi:hypothetical protein
MSTESTFEKVFDRETETLLLTISDEYGTRDIKVFKDTVDKIKHLVHQSWYLQNGYVWCGLKTLHRHVIDNLEGGFEKALKDATEKWQTTGLHIAHLDNERGNINFDNIALIPIGLNQYMKKGHPYLVSSGNYYGQVKFQRML